MSVHFGITDALLAVKTSQGPISAPVLEDMLYFLTGRRVEVGWRQTLTDFYCKNTLMLHYTLLLTLAVVYMFMRNKGIYNC